MMMIDDDDEEEEEEGRKEGSGKEAGKKNRTFTRGEEQTAIEHR